MQPALLDLIFREGRCSGNGEKGHGLVRLWGPCPSVSVGLTFLCSLFPQLTLEGPKTRADLAVLLGDSVAWVTELDVSKCTKLED